MRYIEEQYLKEAKVVTQKYNWISAKNVLKKYSIADKMRNWKNNAWPV